MGVSTFIYTWDLEQHASGALSELSAENANRPYIVAGVTSRWKHVHEWRHGQFPNTVECVETAVMFADIWS